MVTLEGADVAALRPLVSLFVSTQWGLNGQNMIETEGEPTRERKNQDSHSRPHTGIKRVNTRTSTK